MCNDIIHHWYLDLSDSDDCDDDGGDDRVYALTMFLGLIQLTNTVN